MAPPITTRFYWIPLLVTFLAWAGVIVGFLYLGDIVYDDHDNHHPYKDSGFMGSFDWSDTDGGALQRYLTEGYAAAHGGLLLLFALLRGRDRLTILRRLFFVSTVSALLFQTQMMATRLPDPNPHNVGRRWRYIHMPAQYVYGALFVQFYSGNLFLRIFSWVASAGGIFVLIPTHYLYTVDVETGILTGLTVFLVFHWHVRTTFTICKLPLLAWFEVDFLRWHTVAVEEHLAMISRDELRARSESVNTIQFVEGIAVGKIAAGGIEGEEHGDDAMTTTDSQVNRNNAIIAASLARPLVSEEADDEDGVSDRGGFQKGGAAVDGAHPRSTNDDDERRSDADAARSRGASMGPAYAAGGEDGFARHGYTPNVPESDYLMEHFRAPPYCVDYATHDLCSIMDAVEQQYYRLPDGSVSRGATGVGSDRKSYIFDPAVLRASASGGGSKGGEKAPLMGSGKSTAGGADHGAVGPSNHHSVEIHISAESAAAIHNATAHHNHHNSSATIVDRGHHVSATAGSFVGAEEATTEGEICCGIRVSNSTDPIVAAAEKKNWMRRQLIIGLSTFLTAGFGGALAMANEIPIHIADANRPIGIPQPWDLFHEYLPKVPDRTPDYLMYPFLAAGFGYLFLHTHRWTILRRTCFWYGLCMGGRCLTVPATFLPDPSPLCKLPEHPPGTTCGDLIYSGHTLTFCAVLSVIWKYADPLWVRAGAAAYAACGAMAIICSRLHYTRDVYTALMVAFAAYHLVHRVLIHRIDIYVDYKLLRYFEFDYFCFLVEDRQLAREGKERRHLWIRGGVGETFAQVADAYNARKARRALQQAHMTTAVAAEGGDGNGVVRSE